jgi:hypothetical protein
MKKLTKAQKEVPMANKIRPIVRAAFRCEGLVYQFERIDVEDGLLVNGDMAEVNAKYDDAHIIDDAENRLDICLDGYNLDDPDFIREARQLRAFLNRFKKAAA